MAKRKTTHELLRDVDDLMPKAMERLKEVLQDPLAKRTEILNSADKIIKYRFMFQEQLLKEATYKIDLEMKQLSLEEKRIRVEALKGGGNPDGEPNMGNRSRPFLPPPSESMKDAEEIHRVS